MKIYGQARDWNPTREEAMRLLRLGPVRDHILYIEAQCVAEGVSERALWETTLRRWRKEIGADQVQGQNLQPIEWTRD